MNSIEVKAEIACYLRYVRQYPLICFEAFNQDIVTVDTRRRLMWVEIKVSISDLMADRKKSFHRTMQKERGQELPALQYLPLLLTESWIFPTRFFFAVPSDMAEKAHKKIIEHYPWAGLLSVDIVPWRRFLGHGVTCIRKAQHIHDRKLHVRTALELVRCQSASLANICGKFARLQKGVPYGRKAANHRNSSDIKTQTVAEES